MGLMWQAGKLRLTEVIGLDGRGSEIKPGQCDPESCAYLTEATVTLECTETKGWLCDPRVVIEPLWASVPLREPKFF